MKLHKRIPFYIRFIRFFVKMVEKKYNRVVGDPANYDYESEINVLDAISAARHPNRIILDKIGYMNFPEGEWSEKEFIDSQLEIQGRKNTIEAFERSKEFTGREPITSIDMQELRIKGMSEEEKRVYINNKIKKEDNNGK